MRFVKNEVDSLLLLLAEILITASPLVRAMCLVEIE